VARNTFVAHGTDGMEVFAVLHVADGLIHELEVARMDGQPLATPPPAADFEMERVVP
jgi:hypothetical protein